MRSCSTWELSPTLFFLLGVILCINCDAKNYKGGDRAACHDHEREALIKFRSGLEYDSYHQVATWGQIATGDCCKWRGVECDTQTGYVHQLRLFPDLFLDIYYFIWDGINKTGRLSGHLDPVLLELEHLRFLDLSGNAFTGMPIPEFLGSFKDLQCLNLSDSYFAGQIPHQLGTLSNLEQLDIRGPYNYSDFHFDLSANSLHWLKGMPMLKILRLNWVNLSEIGNDWIHVLNDGLPSLNELDLSDCSIGKIATTITSINFNHLRELLLPSNEFESNFPSWIANISSLEFVDLSSNGFHGPIPSSICSVIPDLSSSGIEGLLETCLHATAHPLPNLRVLNLAENYRMSGTIPSWLGKLRSMEELDLSYCNLSGPIPPNFCDLSSLRILYLHDNLLSGPIPLNFGDLSSLHTLDLDNNRLSGPIPHTFGNLSSLRILYLQDNHLSGPIPPNFGNLSSLRILYLQDNHLSGPIPPNFGNLSSLRILYLDNNRLSGILPTTIWNLSGLEEFLLHNNLLMGHIGDTQLNQLKMLTHLDLSSNSFVLHLASEWAPTFQLELLHLKACSLGPSFPQWLITQKSLRYLVLSNTSIEDSLPPWFWDFASPLRWLDLSHNQIKGLLQKTWNYSFMDSYFDLSNNQFSGPLPQTYLTSLPFFFLISDNQITGTIPNLPCDKWNPSVVNLARNHIVGNIPTRFGNCSALEILDLSSNYLTGELPFSISKLNSLASLCLANNKLLGTIPLSLRNASSLTLLDLGENNLSGNLLPLVHNTILRIVRLRSNKFTGALPANFSSMDSLQILDLSDNMLSGLIPKSIGKFASLMTKVHNESMILYGEITLFDAPPSSYVSELVMSFKGNDLLYDKNLGLVGGIDLSRNNFYGEIPKELTRLKGLIFLNLSNNHFTGTIPESIGELRWLESFDISHNQLEGEIPSSLLQLTFLEKLNLSNNHLLGRIPVGGQLQILGDLSIYEGNIGLCGPPLKKQCVAIDTVPTTPDLEHEKGDDRRWLYMGMMFGFVFGFWAFWGLLIFNKSARIAFYKFFDAMMGKLFLLIVIYLAKVKTKV